MERSLLLTTSFTVTLDVSLHVVNLSIYSFDLNLFAYILETELYFAIQLYFSNILTLKASYLQLACSNYFFGVVVLVIAFILHRIKIFTLFCGFEKKISKYLNF